MPMISRDEFFEAAVAHQEQWANTKAIAPAWAPEAPGTYPMAFVGMSFLKTKTGDNYAMFPQLECMVPGAEGKIDGGWYIEMYSKDDERISRQFGQGVVASFLGETELSRDPKEVLEQLEELAAKRVVFTINYEKKQIGEDEETGEPKFAWTRTVLGVDLSHQDDVTTTEEEAE